MGEPKRQQGLPVYIGKKILSEYITPEFNLLAPLIKPSYARADIDAIEQLLDRYNTFSLKIKPNGLYGAITTDDTQSVSGMTYTWVRDSVMIANYQHETGHSDIACKTIRALEEFFGKYRHRFTDIIDGKADKTDVMKRPHIRFNGDTLEEVDQQWAHAENDALGYALWMTFRLANESALPLSEESKKVWALFPAYFEAIEYWEDEDSGHWEEAQKIESSSIGPVVAGLREMKKYLDENGQSGFTCNGRQVSLTQIDELIDKGAAQLDNFLPWESPPIRKADSALLFLIYPLDITTDEQADDILATVVEDLMGDYGFKRYLKDSYWCADYKKLLPEDERTADFSDNMEARDMMLKAGTEAQWSLFDPIISIIYGQRYLAGGDPEDLNRQTYFFNRALTQITGTECAFGAGKCPEAYYIEDSEAGLYVSNDHVPLAWTQANLATALKYMKDSVARSGPKNSAGGPKIAPS